ncbi:response regulator [Roseateles sp.]|uniref:response regulator n=1 Tax=Roseateles sp. TaxID=1971397 RepID=UPI003BAC9803
MLDIARFRTRPRCATICPMDVLLVEDSVAIRRLVARRIGLLPGLRVTGEASGEAEALALFRSIEPDIVVTDLSLADGSGLSLTAALRRCGFTGHIAIMTARDVAPYQRASRTAGANALYDKGGGLETLFNDLADIGRDETEDAAACT